MSITRVYTVDRIVSGKIVLLERDDESIQVVVGAKDFAPVKEGDVIKVTWTSEVGGASSYTVKLRDTEMARERVQGKLDKLKNRTDTKT